MPRAAVKSREPEAPTIVAAPQHETHSTDFQIGQHKPITDDTPRNDVSREKSNGHRLFGSRLKRKDDLFLLDGIEVDEAYLAELAFYEEPVTIVINPSNHKNAASIFENWSNGTRAEMFINGRWVQVGDLPVGKRITIKRKIVEHIIRARVESVQTDHEDATVASPRNRIVRTPSQVHSFSIVEDKNPRGADWLSMAYDRPI